MAWGSLIARFGGDSTEFERCVAKCEATARRFGHNVSRGLRNTVAGYIGLAAAVDVLKEAMERAATSEKLSKRFETDTTSIQELGYAATKTDASLENMGRMLLAVNRARGAALGNPSGKEAEYFKNRGISSDDLKNSSAVELLYKLSDAIKKAGNAEDELNHAFSVFGRAVPPVFVAMREGLRGLAKDAHDFGQVLDKDTIAEVEKFQKSFARTKASFGNWMLSTVAKVWNNTADMPHAVTSGIVDTMLGTDPANNSYQMELRLRKKLEEAQARKAEREKNKAHTPINEKEKTTTYTPEQWAFKPQSGGLAEIGIFGASAKYALVSNLELVKDATERTAKATETIAENTATEREQDE